MMSIATSTSSLAPMPTRRWSVDEYHRMIECGVLTEDDRVELLEGWIVPKMGHNPPHATTIDRTHEALKARIPAQWRVRVQLPITTDRSEPEPDLVIAMGPASRYEDHHPRPEEIAAVIEVADATLSSDRDIKQRIYARAGIRYFWIVNIPSQTVEAYTLPATGEHVGYPTPEIYSIKDSVPLKVGDLTTSVPVFDLFNG
jgi:putative restriction endonuclease